MSENLVGRRVVIGWTKRDDGEGGVACVVVEDGGDGLLRARRETRAPLAHPDRPLPVYDLDREEVEVLG